MENLLPQLLSPRATARTTARVALGATVSTPVRVGIVAGCLALAIAILVPSGAQAAEKADEATTLAFISDLGNEATRLLGDTSVSQREREKIFARLLAENFDLEAISRFVLARHWRKAKPAQQAAFQEAFGVAMAKQFAPLFARYQGPPLKAQDFTPDGKHKQIASASVFVQTASGEMAHTEWRVLRTDSGEYKVIDAKIEGVSMSLTLREEFSAVVSRVGIEGLILELQRRAGS